MHMNFMCLYGICLRFGMTFSLDPRSFDALSTLRKEYQRTKMQNSQEGFSSSQIMHHLCWFCTRVNLERYKVPGLGSKSVPLSENQCRHLSVVEFLHYIVLDWFRTWRVFLFSFYLSFFLPDQMKILSQNLNLSGLGTDMSKDYWGSLISI